MTEPKIKKLVDLIQEYKGHKVSIVKQKLSNLTAPGDNYFSKMVRVEATLRNEENGDEELLHAVAKSADLNDSNVPKQYLNWAIAMTYRNEFNFYTEIIPVLRKFQSDNGVKDVLDIFPQLFSGRLNVNGSDKPDTDAVILLENLVESGYSNSDRLVGFDFEAAKLILKDLAAFHAVPLALKLKDPETFEKKIKAYCKRLNIPPSTEAKGRPKYQVWLEILEDYESCVPYLPQYTERLKKAGGRMEEILIKSGTEPFATLIHCDLWINNTMQKFRNGKVVKNKLVDFQIFTYASPAHDVVFLLNTSVQTEVLRSHYDDLLKYYHENLIKVLKDFKCDTGPFSYRSFIEEFKKIAPEEAAGRTPHMMFPLFGEKGVATNIHDRTGPSKKDVPQVAKDRLRFIVEDLGKRGWL